MPKLRTAWLGFSYVSTAWLFGLLFTVFAPVPMAVRAAVFLILPSLVWFVFQRSYKTEIADFFRPRATAQTGGDALAHQVSLIFVWSWGLVTAGSAIQQAWS